MKKAAEGSGSANSDSDGVLWQDQAVDVSPHTLKRALNYWMGGDALNVKDGRRKKRAETDAALQCLEQWGRRGALAEPQGAPNFLEVAMQQQALHGSHAQGVAHGVAQVPPQQAVAHVMGGMYTGNLMAHPPAQAAAPQVHQQQRQAMASASQLAQLHQGGLPIPLGYGAGLGGAAHGVQAYHAAAALSAQGAKAAAAGGLAPGAGFRPFPAQSVPAPAPRASATAAAATKGAGQSRATDREDDKGRKPKKARARKGGGGSEAKAMAKTATSDARVHAVANSKLGGEEPAQQEGIFYDESTHPETFLRRIFRKRGYCIAKRRAPLTEYKSQVLEEQTKGYTNDLLKAVRESDLAKLEEIFEEGTHRNACNVFGESIVHMAARRGDAPLMEFLLSHGASLCASDDFGRTALHDAFWTADVNPRVVEVILNHDLTLLRVADIRGFTPLQYARRETWTDWCRFFDERKEIYWKKLEADWKPEETDDFFRPVPPYTLEGVAPQKPIRASTPAEPKEAGAPSAPSAETASEAACKAMGLGVKLGLCSAPTEAAPKSSKGVSLFNGHGYKPKPVTLDPRMFADLKKGPVASMVSMSARAPLAADARRSPDDKSTRVDEMLASIVPSTADAFVAKALKVGKDLEL